VRQERPPRYPWWQLILLGLVGLVETATWPLRRMWRSGEPLDAYALVHMASVGGDALLAVALADSVFFDLPVDEAKVRVALYLALSMAPFAAAGPLLVPLLDRAGPRRAIAVGAAAGRAVVALYAAPRLGTLVLFPAAFLLLVLSRVHGVAKNGFTMAFAGRGEGLMRANARLGRIAAAGAALAAGPGLLILRLAGSAAVLAAAAAVYAVAALLALRLPHPRVRPRLGEVGPRGRIPALTAPAIGGAGLRAASGFLLFLLAFALRREGLPTWWFGTLAAAGTGGGLLADLLAPRLPTSLREEAVVVGCVLGAGLGALIAFQAFALPVLAAFAVAVGGATEFGRLAFQALMQRHAPAGALGRVFVRYEVAFQLAWVAGALLPAILPLGFRPGILGLAGFYLLSAAAFFGQPYVERRLAAGRGPGEPGIERRADDAAG
jgi:hypothetical protein